MTALLVPTNTNAVCHQDGPLWRNIPDPGAVSAHKGVMRSRNSRGRRVQSSPQVTIAPVGGGRWTRDGEKVASIGMRAEEGRIILLYCYRRQDVDAIVNTVNTVGIMGKGIALQFKQN